MCYIWVKVIDTGCGMIDEEQKNLFSRFSQASPRTHVKYGGSGLGLFISKSLAMLQGGAIGVASEANVGSTFAFFVSARQADPPSAYGSRLLKQRPLLNRITSYEEAMKSARLNVLIVEDNLVNQRVLKKQLVRCGWTVYVVGNGQEALDWLKGSKHWRGEHQADSEDGPANSSLSPPTDAELDIILLDIEMPVMDGLTCVRRIREYEDQGLLHLPLSSPAASQEAATTTPAEPLTSSTSEKQTPRLPILAVSANARMEQIQQAVTAGMDDAITKPFRIQELWPKMQALIPKL
jgi:CheY-like chemotaxis protein